MTLKQVRQHDPFAALRDFDDAARFHVWHRRMGVENPADDAAVAALAAGRGLAIFGPPGSGKTSSLAAAALGSDEHGATHVTLSLSVAGSGLADHAGDPRYFAGRLVRGIAMLTAEAERLTDEAATAGTASRAATTWKAQAGPRFLQLSREVRQRTDEISFERTPEEVLAVAADAVSMLRGDGVRPVVLLEDADGLLRLPGLTDAQRFEIAEAFLADGLSPLLRAVGVPALLAVQPEYVGLAGFAAVAALMDDPVAAPAPSAFTDDGVRILLGELLRTSRVDRGLPELFTDEALQVLIASRYSLPTIRALLFVCDRALLQAASASADIIDESHVSYAVTQAQ